MDSNRNILLEDGDRVIIWKDYINSPYEIKMKKNSPKNENEFDLIKQCNKMFMTLLHCHKHLKTIEYVK